MQRRCASGLLALAGLLACSLPAQGAAKPRPAVPRLAFSGLHGGVFQTLQQKAAGLPVRLDYVTNAEIAAGTVDFSVYRVVIVQHFRAKLRDRYRLLFKVARERRPDLRIFSLTGSGLDLFEKKLVQQDPALSRYYRSPSPANLRRLLVFVLATYCGLDLEVEPPEKAPFFGLYHPDHQGLFDDAREFLAWAKRHHRDLAAPRAAIAVHNIHLEFQQPKVVEALIRALERRGALAVAVVDAGEGLDALRERYEQNLRELHCGAVVHTCHSPDTVAFREELGVPHLHSIFFTGKSIRQWRESVEGLDPGSYAFQVASQEMLGAIEPQVGAGTEAGGGSSESFTPIPERIEHLASRTMGWLRLRAKPDRDKRLALIYYDREMGKGELMRGSATGMFLNGPRSLMKVLARLRREGYTIGKGPRDERELLSWMQARGRQIGMWDPAALQRLVKNGDPVRVPVATYEAWLEKHLSEGMRRKLSARWGPPPGKFMVWRDHAGKAFLVIPRLKLGRLVLLPQPLRGEAQDPSVLHDRTVVPPHNYVATYLWLQEQFKADALVHFGTHGSEFILPGKQVGLSGEDWSDVLLGSLPNVNPWIINNLGEASGVKRRAYAVLVSHQTPPIVGAGVADGLLNLQADISKRETLPAGALKEKFRTAITAQCKEQHLGADLHIELAPGALLDDKQIRKLDAYLHELANETMPKSLHVLGSPPPRDLVVPYLVSCLRQRGLDALATVAPATDAPPRAESETPGRRHARLRRFAEKVVASIVLEGATPARAIEACGGRVSGKDLPKKVAETLAFAADLYRRMQEAPAEIDHLISALAGGFVPPGPGGTLLRNPAALPTGRNLYQLNPEEIPARPSWELGKTLAEQMLSGYRARHGHYPEQVAFALSSFATFMDYGVMEAQILRLLGVAPIWDRRNQVRDLRVVPRAELGRPRVDVFLSVHGYYRDSLPTRMALLDRAVRLVRGLNEPDNFVRRHSRQISKRLRREGLGAERAELLAAARLFGAPPGAYSSAAYYYLIERSGEWETREDLMRLYLERVRHVYTQGAWGEWAPKAYAAAIDRTEVVMRNWTDPVTSPLADKYTWFTGGSLALAVRHLTGRVPEFQLNDVRDPDRARVVAAEDALRKDFRVRLFNRKWITGMMKEGYAGADQIATHVSNTLGWKIMREHSITDDIWKEIVEIYLRDSRGLQLREWFEAENPFAFQELTEILLETIRKGYWKPDQATVTEIAKAYAESVVRHGEGGGLRGGGNVKLDRFVDEALAAPGTAKLRARYQEARQRSAATPALPETAAMERKQGERKQVAGKKMQKVESPTPAHGSWPWLAAAGMLLLFLLGVFSRAGALR